MRLGGTRPLHRLRRAGERAVRRRLRKGLGLAALVGGAAVAGAGALALVAALLVGAALLIVPLALLATGLGLAWLGADALGIRP